MNQVLTTGAAALTVTQIESLVVYVAGLFHLPPLPENVAAAAAVLCMIGAHAIYARFNRSTEKDTPANV